MAEGRGGWSREPGGGRGGVGAEQVSRGGALAHAGFRRAVVAPWRREKSRSRQETCVCTRVVMEAPPAPLAATTPASGRSRRLLLLPLLLFLLPTGALRGQEAEERPRTRQEECHFYAGGQVYPGEASRASPADHSLHHSKAKSRWCPAKRKGGWGGVAKGGGR